jgi:hypothetical protein
VSVPKHLAAFDGRPEDFFWYPAEKPAKSVPTAQSTQTVAPPVPATPTLPTMKIVPGPISLEELTKNLAAYCDAVTKIPNWQTLLDEKNRVAKEARRLARREQRIKLAT